jgi:peptide/nickel transport system permease protein
MLGDYANPKDAAELTAKLGLDKPIIVQYGEWMLGVLRGRAGVSLYHGNSVTGELWAAIPVSAELAVLGVLLSLIIGLPLGLISAVKHDSISDQVSRVVSVLGISIPNFWLAILMLTFLAILFEWNPPVYYRSLIESPVDNLQQMLIPAITLGTFQMALVSRMTRSSMLEVLRQDYIRTARAKGLRERMVIYRHAMKNAMIPVVTVVGLNFGILLGGIVVIEQITGVPGVGRLTLQAINQRDLAQIQINVLFFGVVFAFTNLMVDMIYGFLDPRIRQS